MKITNNVTKSYQLNNCQKAQQNKQNIAFGYNARPEAHPIPVLMGVLTRTSLKVWGGILNFLYKIK